MKGLRGNSAQEQARACATRLWMNCLNWAQTSSAYVAGSILNPFRLMTASCGCDPPTIQIPSVNRSWLSSGWTNCDRATEQIMGKTEAFVVFHEYEDENGDEQTKFMASTP